MLWAILVSGSLMGCQMELDPQESCGFVRNKDDQRVSWKTQGSIDLYVHESMPRHFYPALRRSIESWNEILRRITGRERVMHIVVSGFPGPNLPSSEDARSTVHLMSSWDSKNSSQQAVTTTYWSGARITQADIRFNDRHFDFFVGQGVESAEHGQIHFESLSLHEKGHLLGLAHSQVRGSVMHPSLAANRERLLQRDGPDHEALECEYALYAQ